MKTIDPSTGPIPRAEFAEIVNAPFGKAREAIRKYDPLWGRATGETIKWRVKFTREVTEVGYATVEASSEKEAEEIAAHVKTSTIAWEPDDCFDEDGEVESVEPLA